MKRDTPLLVWTFRSLIMTCSRRSILKTLSLLPLSAVTLLSSQNSKAAETQVMPGNDIAIGEYAIRTGAVSPDRRQLSLDSAFGAGREAFLARHQADFRHSNTIILQGWILSRAEVSRCALSYLNSRA